MVFPEIFAFAQKWTKRTQNWMKMKFSRVFIKFCHYFKLPRKKEVLSLYFPVQIPYLWKFCFTSFRLKMQLSNQIAGFIDHQFLWKECINIFDFCMETFTFTRIWDYYCWLGAFMYVQPWPIVSSLARGPFG